MVDEAHRRSSAARSTACRSRCWGLTFKANTDDLRDSPALVIVRRLARGGRDRAGLRPGGGRAGGRRSVPGLEVVADPYEACDGAAVLAVLTEWDEFRWMDFDRVRRDVADSDRARHPQPARPGRAAPAGLHLRRRRPLVTDHPRRRATDGPRPRAVVTGAAGFLGSHLAERLVDARLGRRRPRQPAHGADGEPRRPARPPGVHVLALRRHELRARRRRGRRGAALREPGEPGRLPRAPDQDDEGRRRSAPTTCSGSSLAKGARFFLASTSEVYGDPQVHPQPEDYWGHVNPVGPRGVYDEAKRFAEALALAYHRSHDLDVRIVRIFNTYGPRLRPADGRVVSNFLVQAMRGRAAHGVRRRQADAVVLLRRRRDPRAHRPARLRPRRPGEHRQPERVHDPRAGRGRASTSPARRRRSRSSRCRPTIPTQRKPDITLAQELLGWAPTVELREGLDRTHAWYRARVRGRCIGSATWLRSTPPGTASCR